MIYLDNNATTRPSEAVARAVQAATTGLWANPSSVHRAGQEVRHALELARREVGALLGVDPKEIVLTSGGTESIDLAIRGVLEAFALAHPRGRGHRSPSVASGAAPTNLITTAIEHAAVRDIAGHLAERGVAEVRWLPLNSRGMVDASALAGLIDDHTALVSVQWANNETGVIQPVEQIGEICRERPVPFHCDAVQWVGKMPLGERPRRRSDEPKMGGAQTPAPRHLGAPALPCDLLSFSAHKFHGPKGLGGLWIRRGIAVSPQIRGAQEMDRRGGTENVAGVVGARLAAREAVEWLVDAAPRARLAALRDRFEQGVLDAAPGAIVNGAGCPRLWNTSNIGFPALEAEALLLLLSERGLCASAGAACSSGSLEPSPVLLAMGIPDTIAHGSLRFSLGRDTTLEETDQAIGIVGKAAAQLRRSGGTSAADPRPG